MHSILVLITVLDKEIYINNKKFYIITLFNKYKNLIDILLLLIFIIDIIYYLFIMIKYI